MSELLSRSLAAFCKCAHASLPLVAATLALAAPSARAGSISYVDEFFNITSQQLGNGNDLSSTGAFFSADLNTTTPNPYFFAMFGLDNTKGQLMPQITPTDYRYQSGLFANQAAMDAAYPFGNYGFAGFGTTIDSTELNYTATDYTLSSPYLTGTDYSSLQDMNPSQAFTFHISPDITGSTATDSYIFFTIYDKTTNQAVFDAGFLSPTTTSVLLPANTLLAGHTYDYEIDFSNRDILAMQSGAEFAPEVGFDTRTDGTFVAGAATPEPRSALLLGTGLIALALLQRRLRARA